MPGTSKPPPNMLRPGQHSWGPYIGDDKDQNSEDIPQEGWFISYGKTGNETNIFYDGRKVKWVRSMEYRVEAGNLAILNLEIVAPKIQFNRAKNGTSQSK